MALGLQENFAKLSNPQQINLIMQWANEFREGNMKSLPEAESVLLRGEELTRMIAINMVLTDILRGDFDRGIAIVQAILLENNQRLIPLMQGSIFPVLSQSASLEKLVKNYKPKQEQPLQHGARPVLL